jgi:hypothetical protein
MSSSTSSTDAPVMSLDDDNTSKVLTLLSQDDQSFAVPVHQALLSKLISTTLEMDSNASEIRLNLPSSLLKYVVEYFALCDGKEMPEIAKPLRSSDLTKCVQPVSNADFINDFYDKECKDSNEPLYKLVNAANYLLFESLLMISGAKIAAIVKSVKLDQLKETLHRGLNIQPSSSTTTSQ